VSLDTAAARFDRGSGVPFPVLYTYPGATGALDAEARFAYLGLPGEDYEPAPSAGAGQPTLRVGIGVHI